MCRKWIFLILAIAIMATLHTGNALSETTYASGSSLFSNESKHKVNISKVKDLGETLEACGVDSFWVRYYPIIIHVNSKECYITPKIGETTLVINPFPFVEYLVENQTKNPPFVTQKDLGEIIVFHDGGEIWISTFKKGKSDLELIVPADTTECYAQTFSPGFEKFYRLLKIYHSNYLTQERYYEEHHKLIED